MGTDAHPIPYSPRKSPQRPNSTHCLLLLFFVKGALCAEMGLPPALSPMDLVCCWIFISFFLFVFGLVLCPPPAAGLPWRPWHTLHGEPFGDRTGRSTQSCPPTWHPTCPLFFVRALPRALRPPHHPSTRPSGHSLTATQVFSPQRLLLNTLIRRISLFDT